MVDLQHTIALLHAAEDGEAGEIVKCALERSFSRQQVRKVSHGDLSPTPLALVAIHPSESFGKHWRSLFADRRKIVLLGRLGDDLASRMGLRRVTDPRIQAEDGQARPDEREPWNESRLAVRASDHELGRSSPYRRRPLCRFDFAEEWNNLGFGRITLDSSPWGLAGEWTFAGATSIAWLEGGAGEPTAFAALHENPDAAVLWINRAVGPVDSLEWRWIEAFLGDYRPDRLACFPYVEEIPGGFQAAASPRLDCDEAIASARPLFELYAAQQIPLTLAIKTGQLIESPERRLLQDLLHAGGAVVSHSVNHLPNWGGNFEAARKEARQSRVFLESLIDRPVRYAVSPFHQNPAFAVQAVAEQYDGFASGIIANDPEFLLGRAGNVPHIPAPFVSLSQQCMLHGDCFHRYGASVSPYIESFGHQKRGRAIFGYLDHPFSDRYQYGWVDEEDRLRAHQGLIDAIQAADRVWWPNLNSALDFLRRRSRLCFHVDPRERLQVSETSPDEELRFTIRWRGEGHRV